MSKHDEYISGPHDSRIYFFCGLVFGAVVSTWISVTIFESAAFILTSAAFGALVIAFCCARWGDSAWYWLIEHLPWIR